MYPRCQTKKTCPVFVFGAFLIGANAAGVSARQVLPPPATPSVNKNPPVQEGCRILLELQQRTKDGLGFEKYKFRTGEDKTLLLGEPVWIKTTLENLTPSTVIVGEGPRDEAFHFQVKTADNQRVRLTRLGQRIADLEAEDERAVTSRFKILLEKGQKIVGYYLVSRLYDMTLDRAYVITATRYFTSSTGGSLARSAAFPVTFSGKWEVRVQPESGQ